MVKVAENVYSYLRQQGYVSTRVHWFVGWFVDRITQKLLERFPPDLDGGWVLAQNRPHFLDPDNGTDAGMFFSASLTLCDMAFFNIFLNFS